MRKERVYEFYITVHAKSEQSLIGADSHLIVFPVHSPHFHLCKKELDFQGKVYKAPRLVFILILYKCTLFVKFNQTANTGTAMLSNQDNLVCSDLAQNFSRHRHHHHYYHHHQDLQHHIKTPDIISQLSSLPYLERKWKENDLSNQFPISK